MSDDTTAGNDEERTTRRRIGDLDGAVVNVDGSKPKIDANCADVGIGEIVILDINAEREKKKRKKNRVVYHRADGIAR